MIRVLRRVLVGLLAFVGLATILLLVGGGAVVYWARDWLESREQLPESIVLTLDLRETLTETPRSFSLPLPGLHRSLTISDVVLQLEAAAKDPRVKGLVATIDDSRHGLGIAQELRQSVARFARAGKFTFAWSDSFSELGSGLEGYYVASAFDEIALQPIGSLGTTGIAIETPFVRGLLDKLGIEPNVLRRAEYKTALESFSETEPTAANKEMLEALVDGLWGRITADIATSRRLDPAKTAALLGRGPYSAAEARELGLVDRIAYRDEVGAEVLKRAGAGSGLVGLAAYRLTADEGAAAPGVALIRGSGAIKRGQGDLDNEMAADDLVETITDAANDPAIRAILLRIDTPGGSAVASETIARAIRNAKTKGKPVIVSMSNTAASGGYWISMDATRIVAQPMTLTGSIGVIAGKPVIREASARLGVHWAIVTRGEHAGLWSATRSWDDASRAPLERMIDETYGRFKEGVARGRKLAATTVDTIARGRVYTGEQALQLGLVDRLGGLQEALAEVREALRLQADAPLDIVILPKPRPPWRLVSRLMEGGLMSLGDIGAILGAIGDDGAMQARAVDLRAR